MSFAIPLTTVFDPSRRLLPRLSIGDHRRRWLLRRIVSGTLLRIEDMQHALGRFALLQRRSAPRCSWHDCRWSCSGWIRVLALSVAAIALRSATGICSTRT